MVLLGAVFSIHGYHICSIYLVMQSKTRAVQFCLATVIKVMSSSLSSFPNVTFSPRNMSVRPDSPVPTRSPPQSSEGSALEEADSEESHQPKVC